MVPVLSLEEMVPEPETSTPEGAVRIAPTGPMLKLPELTVTRPPTVARPIQEPPVPVTVNVPLRAEGESEKKLIVPLWLKVMFWSIAAVPEDETRVPPWTNTWL